MVYELYFPEELRAAGCGVMCHLSHLPEFTDAMANEEKLELIEGVYKELSHPTHAVSIAMARMGEVEEVRIIVGR